MAWRKWIVRGIVYGILGACGLAALLYQRWTNPAAVREQVIAKLSALFPGAQVAVDSAQLRLLGGIQINGLRFARRDDPEKHDFLHVPSAVLYHDKEKILEGELAMRKLELYRPRLRLRRSADGQWNVQGILGVVRLDIAVPTIVVHQGTLIVEDRQETAKMPGLEVNEVSLTIINDPLPTITLRGSANSALFGQLQVQGSSDRPTNDLSLNFQATRAPVTTALVMRFAGPHQDALSGFQVEARADLSGKLSYRPQQAIPFRYELQGRLSDGKVQHPQLPLPLDKLQAAFQVNNGEVVLDSLTARSGAAEIEASGSGLLASLDKNFEAHLDVKHLALSEELTPRLPEKIRKLMRMFDPKGPTTLHIDCARRDGQWTDLSHDQPSTVSLRPENVSLAFIRFPYPLERTTGAIDYHLVNKHVQVDLTTYAGDRPVFLKGQLTGEGIDADAKFDIHAQDVELDDAMLAALASLPPATQALARSFNAKGKADVNAHIRHKPGEKDYANEFHVRFHDMTMCWNDFPYPLERVSGTLDIYPKHWLFSDFQGWHNGGHVLLHGRSTPTVTPEGEKKFGVFIEITGRNIALDADLQEASRTIPAMQKSWKIFQPSGRLWFTASVNRPSADPYDLDINVDAKGCAVEPIFFPYLFSDLSGQFRYHHHRLELTKVRAKHGPTLVSLDRGVVDVHPKGGYYADLLDVQAQHLSLDDAFVKALPKRLQDAAGSLKLKGLLSLKSRVVAAQASEPSSLPDVYWDGQVRLKEAQLSTGFDWGRVTGTVACAGRYNGRQLLGVNGNLLLDSATVFHQPFANVQAQFQIRENAPDVLLVGVRAPAFGGDIAGQVRVDFNSTLRYEANLTASQIDLKPFGKHNLGDKSEISGMAMARLHLTGQGTGLDSLDGHGSLDALNGKLYNLPLLHDVMQVIGAKWPNSSTFEEMHANFALQGKRVQLKRLDLLGNAVSLSGNGEFNLDGSDVHLDFYPTWGRLEQLLPPAVRPFPVSVSKNLVTIEMRGKITSNPHDRSFMLRPLPIVIDPLMLVRDRLFSFTNSDKKN